jgi:hypothetical protein
MACPLHPPIHHPPIHHPSIIHPSSHLSGYFMYSYVCVCLSLLTFTIRLSPFVFFPCAQTHHLMYTSTCMLTLLHPFVSCLFVRTYIYSPGVFLPYCRGKTVKEGEWGVGPPFIFIFTLLVACCVHAYLHAWVHE